MQERNSRQRTGGGIQYARGSTDEQGIPADGRGTHVAVTMRFRATSSRGQGKTRGEDRTAFEIEEAGEQKVAAQLTTGSGSGCMCASLRAHRTRCSPQTQTEATTGGDGEAVAVAHGGCRCPSSRAARCRPANDRQWQWRTGGVDARARASLVPPRWRGWEAETGDGAGGSGSGRDDARSCPPGKGTDHHSLGMR